MKRLLAASIVLISTITAASAADLQKQAYKAPVAAVPAPWSGFYAGVSLGYGIDTSGLNGAGSNPSGAAPTISALAAAPNGWLFGGRIGYDWYLSPIVFGLETDLQYANFQSNGGSTINPFGNALSLSAKTDWWGSANARLGVPIGDSLLYGIGGLAYGNRTANGVAQFNTTNTAGAVSLSGTQIGYDIGAGIETKLTPNSGVFFEYRYIDLGSLNGVFTSPASAGGVTTSISVPMSFQTFTVGYNLHF